MNNFYFSDQKSPIKTTKMRKIYKKKTIEKHKMRYAFNKNNFTIIKQHNENYSALRTHTTNTLGPTNLFPFEVRY